MIENMKLKLITKSQIEFRRLELLLIANKKMRIYSSASIAANPLLCVRPFSVVIYNVGLCRTVECCLCVGTRQALLQGWLLCVGFVCLANVPDLVRWILNGLIIIEEPFIF